MLISGCSGGGKSTLLAELKNRGQSIVEEPGRRIVADEMRGTGQALPWVDLTAFALKAIALARSDLVSAQEAQGNVFFDRGLVDAAVALEFASGEPYTETLGDVLHYSKTVFLAPPWPEIFLQDEERRHDLKTATEEFLQIESALVDLGYDIFQLPKVSATDRADFVLDTLRIE